MPMTVNMHVHTNYLCARYMQLDAPDSLLHLVERLANLVELRDLEQAIAHGRLK